MVRNDFFVVHGVMGRDLSTPEILGDVH